MENANQRIALVTGANKGIGLAIARQLGAQAVTVLVGARDSERGEAAAATLRAEGIDARFVELEWRGAVVSQAARRSSASMSTKARSGAVIRRLGKYSCGPSN